MKSDFCPVLKWPLKAISLESETTCICKQPTLVSAIFMANTILGCTSYTVKKDKQEIRVQSKFSYTHATEILTQLNV